MTRAPLDAEQQLRALVPWAALPADAPLEQVVRELNEELWRGMAAQWVLAGRPGDARELEPYVGVRALFNADLATHSPWYAPRQAWLVVRRPAGDGGWDEDHLAAVEKAAAELVREAEDRAKAAEDQTKTLREQLAALEAELTEAKGTTP